MYEMSLIVAPLVWVLVLVVYVRSGVASLFHPLTWYLAFHGLVFALRPIVAFAFGYKDIYYLYEFSPSKTAKLTVMYGATLGLVVFAAACLLASSREKLFARLPTIPLQDRLKLVPVFLIVVAICAPLGIYALSQTIETRAIGRNSMDMVNGVFINTDVNGYVVSGQMMLGTLACVFAWLFRFRLWSLMPFLGFVIFRSATGGRGIIVTSALMLMLLYYMEKRRKWPSVGALVLVGAGLLAFSVLGQDRGALIREKVLGIESGRHYDYFTKRPLEGMDFANMEYFEYLTYGIPAKTGTYGYFLDNLQVFTEPVPRVLWRNKPIGAPIKLFDLWDFGTPIGMTLSLPGEGWAQLGWFGIAIWCGLWGYAYGFIYSLFLRSRMSAYAILLYAGFLPLSIVFFRDGTLITFVRSLLVLAPLVLWWGIEQVLPTGLLAGARFRRVPAAGMRRAPPIAGRRTADRR